MANNQRNDQLYIMQFSESDHLKHASFLITEKDFV